MGQVEAGLTKAGGGKKYKFVILVLEQTLQTFTQMSKCNYFGTGKIKEWQDQRSTMVIVTCNCEKMFIYDRS